MKGASKKASFSLFYTLGFAIVLTLSLLSCSSQKIAKTTCPDFKTSKLKSDSGQRLLTWNRLAKSSKKKKEQQKRQRKNKKDRQNNPLHKINVYKTSSIPIASSLSMNLDIDLPDDLKRAFTSSVKDKSIDKPIGNIDNTRKNLTKLFIATKKHKQHIRQHIPRLLKKNKKQHSNQQATQQTTQQATQQDYELENDLLGIVSFALPFVGIGLFVVATQIAFAAPVFAWLSLFAFIGSIVLGIISLRRINRNPQYLKGRGFAIAGIALSSLILLLTITFIVLFILTFQA